MSGIEHKAPMRKNLVGETVMHHVRRQVSDPRMAVMEVVPIEKGLREAPCGLQDATIRQKPFFDFVNSSVGQDNLNHHRQNYVIF